MRSSPARLAALMMLPMLAAGPAAAFETRSAGQGAQELGLQPAGTQNAAEGGSIWQRFTLDGGQSAGISLRGYRLPQFAPTLTPIVGLNYENAQTASAVRGAWLEAARIGSFAIGPVVSVERHLSLTNRSEGQREEAERLTRFGGFLAYTDAGQEVARLALSTGRTGGLDVRATRSFKLSDNVSFDVGPVISLGSFERFGYGAPAAAAGLMAASPVVAPINVDRAQLGAFGLATAIESRVNDRTVARMFAEYARVDAQRPGAGAPQLPNRDRVDFGFSLTTTIGR
jgi:hypothetical protein